MTQHIDARTGRQWLGDIARAGSHALAGVFQIALRAVRLSLAAVLGILEPFVRVGLIGLALVTVMIALLFRFSGVAPHLPFWGMMGTAAGTLGLLVVYYTLMRLVTK
jgi:hypothetical protein